MMVRTLHACLFAAALAWAAAVPAEDTAQDPHSMVERIAGSIAEELDARQDEFEAQPELLNDLVRQDLMPALDIHYSARLILGRAGRGASPEQVIEFAEAMSELLISRYASGLLEYRDRSLVEVMPARGALNEKQTRVRTRVRLDQGKFIPIDYIFHKTDDGWKAFDVIVEGISYVATYRGQIMPQVQEIGLDGVTARLRSGDLQLNEG